MSMTLDAQEFIPACAGHADRRRFLVHGIPEDFVRVFHFGFLANRSKKHALPQCRKQLGLNPALPKIPD